MRECNALLGREVIRSALLMLALASMAACAPSTPDAAASDAAMPYRGASGSPIGEPATGTIGPADGTLASADGRLVLRVPAGAFSQPTVVGIDPITNTNPHAVGKAYRLSPEGITFSSAVSLTCEYTPADVENRGAAGLGIASRTGTAAGPRRSTAPRKPMRDGSPSSAVMSAGAITNRHFTKEPS